jgi:capsid protein
MQWSKAKQRVEVLFTPKASGRVELRTTNYRRVADWEGRGWITIDGVEAWNFCTMRY